MTQINPFTGAIIQSTQVQPKQSAEKDRQIRRLQNLSKNAALQGDRLEHQVESSDTMHAADDGQDTSQHQQRRSPGREQPNADQDSSSGESHIDLTA